MDGGELDELKVIFLANMQHTFCTSSRSAAWTRAWYVLSGLFVIVSDYVKPMS
jgi:hypothetical protein